MALTTQRPSTDSLTRVRFIPELPRSVEETGLTFDQISDLVVKHLYLRGTLTGYDLSELLGLPVQDVLDTVLAYLQKEHYVEVLGADGGGLGISRYQYSVTDKGRARVREVMERNGYVGPAPVPLADYQRSVEMQAVRSGEISRHVMERALTHLVLNPRIVRQLGPAVNSNQAMFLWGAPGNGKTATAAAISTMLPGNIYIPYAIDIEGSTVRLFDHNSHEQVHDLTTGTLKRIDRRWVRIKRPVIIAGGELTLDNLDLVYNPTTRTSAAPFQMKANNGVFLIDDFGRQAMPPQALLNRWIMPLERRVDYLTLVTGQQIQIPFDTLIIFSTNLDPEALVDEAFLRRIRYKIYFPDPTPEQFRQIFKRYCETRGVPYHNEALKYLIRGHYLPQRRKFRACHPRDLVDQIVDIARFSGLRPQLSRELIDDAAESYFVRSLDSNGNAAPVGAASGTLVSSVN